IGHQKSAASLEQIIAAIDQLKSGTEWRKRLDANEAVTKISKSMMPQDNCEVSIISDEERIDELREACLKVGATGAITTRIVPQTDEETVNTMIRSAVSVPADLTD